MIKQSVARRLPVYMQAADGSPVTGLVWGDVAVKYVKEGENGLTGPIELDPAVDGQVWFEIGQGLYKILFKVAELDTIGFFEYFVTGPGAIQYPGLVDISKYLLIDALGSGFDINTDTLELIRDAITAFSPATHSSTSGNITVGTQIAGTYAKTAIEDEDYWQIQCEAGDDEAGLDVDLTFSVTEGRTPINIIIRGRIKAANNKDCDVYAWNYDIESWEKLTSNSTQMRHSVNDKSYQYVLNFNHHNHAVAGHGEVKLRFVGQGNGFTTSHDLYLDQVIIGSVVEGTVQPDVISHAVWGEDIVTIHGGNNDAGGEVVAIAENVWNRILTKATHNIANSAGKRLRGVASHIIRDETARGPGIGTNQIQLDVDASSVNGAYDPALICIIAGTGSGQSRLIFQYKGSDKIVTVGRDWKVLPDDTSEYIILGHPGREHVNEGLAQGGTSTTITLNALASSNDNVYRDQMVYIRSGKGADQLRKVKAYDGSTKEATIRRPWNVIPDSTSAYAMLPDDATSEIIEEINENEAKLDITITNIATVDGKIDVMDNNIDLILAGTISINLKVDIMDANIDLILVEANKIQTVDDNVDILISRKDHNMVGV